ncbi:type II toxin-antitoxin system VapC family toxin, partial [Thauera aminoaromatica]
MNLLLDTHVALWAITDHPRLPQAARDLILSPKTTVWVSVASVWEIAIKHALGRGDMPVSSRDAVCYFTASGYRLLAIEPEHVVAVETLPAHHQDPFDRLLVAQALVEP